MKIQELFDDSKKLDRKIESVVTFADKDTDDLKKEINEYVVTNRLKNSYHTVVDRMQDGFSETANEVGIWVSGFYGSGKSSFAKYLGFSFDSSLIVDGMTFGEKLLNRIGEPEVTQMHKAILNRFNPMVVMIDLATQHYTGKTMRVSDIIYFETLKALGLTISKDAKIIEFNTLLKDLGKYEEFVALVHDRKEKDWEVVQKNDLLANIVADELAPEILPDYFHAKGEFKSLKIDALVSEDDRIKRLMNLIKQVKGKEKVLFILDELGAYVSTNEDLIFNMQGFMQNIKSIFKGDVWVIGTAQQTLTEDNPQAQLNSDKLFTLDARFPIKIDIEADDIKEIITKRLLGKSTRGTAKLKEMFSANEGSIKVNTKLNIGNARSRYIQIPDPQKFADLYPFLPVHIDILMALLQKLASRTGGVGLRSVIRLIRDILVENRLAEESVGLLATPALFYDVLRSDMEKNSDYKEIVMAADQAINRFQDSRPGMMICKAIAVMQILDDFPLTFDNICALLYSEIGQDTDKGKIRAIMDDIKCAPGITLEEVDGQYRFMTNAILSVKEERNHLTVSDQKRDEILRELVKDLLTPAPQVQIFGSKTIKPSVELSIGRRTQNIHSGDHLKINFSFVEAPDFENVEALRRSESTEKSNERTMYMVSTLPSSIEGLLNDIVRDNTIVSAHANDSNKEVRDYLKSQEEDAKTKKQEVKRLLSLALANSESMWRGQTEAVNATTYISKSLKKFAEKTFEKFSYVSKSMGTNSVRDLSKYDNWASLPESLNPMGFVKADGAIDSGADALREIYDYISANDPDGNKVLSHFESAPFGWAKDTTRYIVALLLKDNKVIVRAGAQNFKMLTDKAAEAMKNNTVFGHVNLSRNTEKQLTPTECLKAKKALTTLFNPGNIALTVDSLAKASFQAMIGGRFKDKAESLSRAFQNVGLAGGEIVAKAIAFAKRIVASEGADGPVLFAQDADCFESMKYVLDVDKADILSVIQTIRRRFREIDELTQLPQLSDFFKNVEDLKEVFRNLLRDENVISHKSEYFDIESKLKSAIRDACQDFCEKQNMAIANKIAILVGSYDMSKLTDEQQQAIKLKSEKVRLSDGTGSFDDLKEAINCYNLAFNPGGPIEYGLKTQIENYLAANEPPEDYGNEGGSKSSGGGDNSDGGGNPGDSGDGTPPPTPKKRPVSVKRNLNKTALRAFIGELQKAMEEMEDIDSVELNLE